MSDGNDRVCGADLLSGASPTHEPCGQRGIHPPTPVPAAAGPIASGERVAVSYDTRRDFREPRPSSSLVDGGGSPHSTGVARLLVACLVAVTSLAMPSSAGDDVPTFGGATSVRCWGSNNSGQCDVPSDLGPVSSEAAGGDHTLAFLEDGSVRCWGWNVSGQCDVPPDLGPVTAVAAGDGHTVALLEDCSVRCWGATTANATCRVILAR